MVWNGIGDALERLGLKLALVNQHLLVCSGRTRKVVG